MLADHRRIIWRTERATWLCIYLWMKCNYIQGICEAVLPDVRIFLYKYRFLGWKKNVWNLNKIIESTNFTNLKRIMEKKYFLKLCLSRWMNLKKWIVWNYKICKIFADSGWGWTKIFSLSLTTGIKWFFQIFIVRKNTNL